MVKVTKTSRLQQVLAIAAMLAIWIMIATKGYGDISPLLETRPEDFWRSLAQYFLDNMAGGAGEQGMCYGPRSCSEPR
jgi:hypothetical protein